MSKRYFHTYDALRSFAFLKVFLHHLPITAFPWFSIISRGGGIGVQFFFVLSGFLISYLILEEKSTSNNFLIKNFFVRRILRIWPLYFLMIGFAYSTPIILDYIGLNYSNEGYQPDWRFSLFFLENYKGMIENNHPNVSPLGVMWSLCIEEHFYIVWGLILYFLPLKHFPKLAYASIAISLISRKFYIDNNLNTSDLFTNIDLFALGGLLAYLLITRQEWLENTILSISNLQKKIFIFSVVLIVVFESFFFKNYTGSIIQPTIFGILFSLLLAIFIPSNSTLKIGDENPLSRLGRLTYGLYLFHAIIINLLLKVFSIAKAPIDRPLNALAFILLAFILSVLCSQISYILIEKPFLKLKSFFYSSQNKSLVREF